MSGPLNIVDAFLIAWALFGAWTAFYVFIVGLVLVTDSRCAEWRNGRGESIVLAATVLLALSMFAWWPLAWMLCGPSIFVWPRRELVVGFVTGRRQ